MPTVLLSASVYNLKSMYHGTFVCHDTKKISSQSKDKNVVFLTEVISLSVIKSKRATSEMEFIATARKLQIYTIQKCVNFPKRYTFFVSQQIANSAIRIYEDVKRGNSIYPLNQHEAQIRRDCFIRANSELQSLISQLEVAQELFGIEMKTLKYWMDIIDAEIRLVKSVMKTDRERYKNLQ